MFWIFRAPNPLSENGNIYQEVGMDFDPTYVEAIGNLTYITPDCFFPVELFEAALPAHLNQHLQLDGANLVGLRALKAATLPLEQGFHPSH